jgi:hypothetical protein
VIPPAGDAPASSTSSDATASGGAAASGATSSGATSSGPAAGSSASGASSASDPADPGGPSRPADPPGLRAQLGATKEAAIGFAQAHVELAKAELEDVKGEVGRAAALGGLAIACLLLLSLVVSVGGILFTGEWIFGSIGWGVLLGAEMLAAVAVGAVLVALRVPGLAADVAVAFLVGLVVALVLGFYLPNRLFTWIGDTTNLAIDPALRPLAIAALIFGVIGALVGLVGGVKAAGGAGGVFGGLIGGLVAGVLVGAFLAISFGLRVGAALGFAVFFAMMPALMGLRTQRQGINEAELKRRFYPAVTIDTAKESLEWVKARVPRRQS